MKKRLIKWTLILLFVAFSGLANYAQTSPEMKVADDFFKDKKWEEAAVAYETVLKNEPNNAGAWYQLATARYSLKQYPQSAEAFQKSADISSGGFAMYNLACVYSLMNDKEKAIEWLTKAIENPKMILQAVNFNDSDFTNIKDDSRFKALAEKIDRKVRPCVYSAESKQFDFWVGEWDVYNPQGRKDGTSVIQSIASGCGILENWTSSLGNPGKSINFYDATAGKWFQYWIGSSGGAQRYSGVYKDGAIWYEGEPFEKNGKKILSRLTFFNIDANTVRQLAENSSDEGKTWTTAYDYKYVRRGSKKEN